MVDITYVTISPYKYTSKLPHFLTPSHVLTLLTPSPYNLLLFLLFFLLYFGVKRERGKFWG